jgi:hypothetical protein
MNSRDTIPDPWLSFLKELDQIAASTVRLDCIGGFVITMLYGLNRPTADVDVLEIAPQSAADAFAQVAMLGALQEIWCLSRSSHRCSTAL